MGPDNRIYILGGQKFSHDQSTNEFFGLSMEKKELLLEKGMIE